MKNLFKLSSLLFVGLVLFQISCSDDAPPPEVVPDPSGTWKFQSATLVDGNFLTPETAEDLVIQDFTDGSAPPAVLTVPVGDVQTTSVLVAGALAATVCEDPTGASYSSFFIEFVSDGDMLFNCPADDPPVADVDMGGWTVEKDDDGKYTLFNLTAVLPAGTLTIFIEDFALSADGNTFTGRALNYPMKVRFLEEFTLDNAQFLTADLVLIKQ